MLLLGWGRPFVRRVAENTYASLRWTLKSWPDGNVAGRRSTPAVAVEFSLSPTSDHGKHLVNSCSTIP
jgi:hypothetical protein